MWTLVKSDWDLIANKADVTRLGFAVMLKFYENDGRVERIPYELCVLIALRDALRRREVYVQGAGRWKNPDEDLPGDFEDNRDVHYAELGKPLDATEFIDGLRKRLDDGLARLDTALARGTSGGAARG